MLQEFQREIRIHFIFWLPNLKRYWLSVLQLLCGKSRLFLMTTGICFQKALSCVTRGAVKEVMSVTGILYLLEVQCPVQDGGVSFFIYLCEDPQSVPGIWLLLIA